MTAPIRSIAELAIGARQAQIERNLSDQAVEELAGLATGALAKYLSPNPRKRLGTMSLFPILGALGKCLAVVDDPEQRALVEKRWTDRVIKGGATLQLRALEKAEITAPEPSSGTSPSISERMREIRKLVKKENLVKAGKNGGKRRAKQMGKRARQAQAAHAARKRWSKRDG